MKKVISVICLALVTLILTGSGASVALAQYHPMSFDDEEDLMRPWIDVPVEEGGLSVDSASNGMETLAYKHEMIFADPVDYGGWADVESVIVGSDGIFLYITMVYNGTMPDDDAFRRRCYIYIDADKNQSTGELWTGINGKRGMDCYIYSRLYGHGSYGHSLYIYNETTGYWDWYGSSQGLSLQSELVSDNFTIIAPLHALGIEGNPDIALYIDVDCDLDDWVGQTFPYTIGNASSIIIDGETSDWTLDQLMFSDPDEGYGPYNYDMTDFYTTDNSTMLFQRFDFIGTLPEALPSDIDRFELGFGVYYDVDQNKTTGCPWDEGAEYAIWIEYDNWQTGSNVYFELEPWNETEERWEWESYVALDTIATNSIFEWGAPLSSEVLDIAPGTTIDIYVEEAWHDFEEHVPNQGYLSYKHPSYLVSDFPELFAFNPDVHMIYPADTTPKPLGCGAAWVSDWLASAYVSTKLGSISEGLDTEAEFVDQATGKALGDEGTAIITFGGQFVNPVVKYAESDGTPDADRAPVKFYLDGIYFRFQYKNGTNIPGAWLPQSVINVDEDMFVIEVYRDGDGRIMMLCYGFGWKGTYAAGKYFEYSILPNLDQFADGWIIVKWDDTNGNGYVNKPSVDDYTLIASGGELKETVKIGLTSPNTDVMETRAAIMEMAWEDIDAHCESNDLNYEFAFVLLDNEGYAAQALENTEIFHAMGVDLVVGHGWSSQCNASLDYVNGNDMLLLSPSSTSPVLKVIGDNLFRLAPADDKQGKAIAREVRSFPDGGVGYDGMEKVVVMNRNDDWGNMLYDYFRARFVDDLGGDVLSRIQYSGTETWFYDELDVAESILYTANVTHGPEKVAFILFGFADELAYILDQVNDTVRYPTLTGITWFGCEGMLRGSSLLDYPSLGEEIGLYSTVAAPEYWDGWYSFASEYESRTGVAANAYAATTYDAFWVYALSVFEANSADSMEVKAALPAVAGGYHGASGWCTLDEYGDRDAMNYEIWGFGYDGLDPAWIPYGIYYWGTDEVDWNFP